MTFHESPPWKIGLAQAVAVLCYVLFFALSVQTIHGWLGDAIFPNPFLGMAFFLAVFVFSALFCATVMLGYPALLCFEKNYRRAAHVILWSIGWLALFLLVMGLIAIVHAAVPA